MNIRRKPFRYVFALSLGVLLLALCQPEASANSFFQGKTIRILVFATPGGGYDYYTRLVTRFIPKYLPGKPRIIVQNMPIGYAAANTLWRSKPDGLTWGVLAREGYLGNIAGERALRFDFSKGIPIGSTADENSFIYIRKDTGMTTVKKLVAALKAGKKPPIMGATTRASSSYVLGKTLEFLVPGLKFKQVLGYPGGSEIDLAIRKGEVQAAGRSKNSFYARVNDLYKSGEIVVLVQTGTVNKKRDPEFPDVPTFWEFAETAREKQLLALVLVAQIAARPFWLPPGMPQDRLRVIREAFRKTVEDPQLIAQAKKARRHVEPVLGKEMEQLYRDAFAAPEEVKGFLRKVLGK